MRLVAAGLCWVLAVQLTAAPPAAQATAPAKLNIVVVEGEGAINNIRQRTARDIVVQVEDENHRPVAGAVVAFTLPSQGASGTFPNGAKTLSITTDASGRAVARGIRPNETVGKVAIRITASRAGQTASATVTQVNMSVPAAAKGGSTGKIIAILAVAGAAAAAGAVVATRNNSKSTPTPGPAGPIGISVGTGTIGAP